MRTANMFDFRLVVAVEPATKQATPMLGLGIPKPRGNGSIGELLLETRMLRDMRIERIQQVREVLFENRQEGG